MSYSALGTRRSALRAFTLIELLVTVGIIAVLIGILIPVVGKVRISAYETSSRAFLQQIDSACQAYYADHRAYPGVFSNAEVEAATQTNINAILGATGTTPIIVAPARMTGSENLTLSLVGGLKFDAAADAYRFDASTLGQGPASFNKLRPGRGKPYMEVTNLSKGKAEPDRTDADAPGDTVIPEFMDRFPEAMPVLYMRARAGSRVIVTQNYYDPAANPQPVPAQYNIAQILPYTGKATGIGRAPKQKYTSGSPDSTTPHGLRTVAVAASEASINKAVATYAYPFDARAYLADPSSYAYATQAPTDAAAQPRKKDSYVLIFAGRDRVYGTEDDLTNFGSVLP